MTAQEGQGVDVPTNRKRAPRIQVRKTFTKAYEEHLILMDFLGRLTPEEVKITKKHGIYKWDAHQKKQKSDFKKPKTG